MSFDDQEHDVDAILAQAYGTGQENPSSSQPQQQQPTAQAAEPAPPEFKEYEFNARGQAIKIKENDPRFSQFLSQGYDYAHNTQAIRAEREAFERSRQEWESAWSPYKEIDQFAKQNPDWWNQVEQSYQQRLSTPAPEGALHDQVRQYIDQQLQPLSKDIPLMKQFLQEQETLKLQKQHADEDAQLDSAIKSIRDKYPGLDFEAKDESGLSLELRVLNHATQNGFPTFRAAFLDYYHDSLEKQAEARGKEAFQKELNARKKMGFLDGEGSPSTPSRPRSLNESANTQRKAFGWQDPQLSSENILREFNFT